MPTADAYRGFAKQLEDAAMKLLPAMAPIRAATGPHVAQGRVAVTVERAIDASEANVNSAAAMVLTMVSECQQRAVVCDNYQVLYDQWKADDLHYRTIALPLANSAMASYNAYCTNYSVAAAAFAKDPKAPLPPNPPGMPPSMPGPPVKPTPPAPWCEAKP